MLPGSLTGCEHCPPGVHCDPTTGACIKGKCFFLFNSFLQSVAVLSTNIICVIIHCYFLLYDKTTKTGIFFCNIHYLFFYAFIFLLKFHFIHLR